MAIPYVEIVLDKPRRLRFTQWIAQQFEDETGKPVSVLEEEEIKCSKCGHVDIKHTISFENINYFFWLMLKRDEPDMKFEDAMKLAEEYSPSVSYIAEKTMAAYNLGLSGEVKPKNGGKPTGTKKRS